MILYGVAGKEIASGTIRAACINCKEPNSINMFIVQRYLHVNAIPLFPAIKNAVTECISCNHVLEKKHFPESYKNDYEEMKSNAKVPLWMFSGLGILAIILVAVFIYERQNDSENAELVLSPQKGDIYEIKLSDNEYTLYRVDKVEGGAVYMLENTYITDMASGVQELLNKPFYKESSPVMKSDLKTMLDKGDIMDIER